MNIGHQQKPIWFIRFFQVRKSATVTTELYTTPNATPEMANSVQAETDPVKR